MREDRELTLPLALMREARELTLPARLDEGRQGADAPCDPGRQGADAPRSRCDPGRQGADAPRSPCDPGRQGADAGLMKIGSHSDVLGWRDPGQTVGLSGRSTSGKRHEECTDARAGRRRDGQPNHHRLLRWLCCLMFKAYSHQAGQASRFQLRASFHGSSTRARAGCSALINALQQSRPHDSVYFRWRRQCVGLLLEQKLAIRRSGGDASIGGKSEGVEISQPRL